jgi:hypothetical protein
MGPFCFGGFLRLPAQSTERKMTESTPQFDCRVLPVGRSLDAASEWMVVVHAALAPASAVSWSMTVDTELRAQGAPVWLTRAGHLDDYWLRPGDVIGLLRGERVWLSVEGDSAAHVTLTSEWRERRPLLQRWLRRLQLLLAGGMPQRA